MAENENVQTEETPVNPLLRTVELRVVQADALAATERALKKYAKEAKMPGFRKGHVPMSQVRAMYGAKAYEDALNDLIHKEWIKVLESGEYHVASAPAIDAGESKEEGTLVFTATFEVMPEVELPAFNELELKRFTCTVGDAEVEKTLEVMRRQRATYEVREGRAAQENDRVTLNFKGTKDGEAFQGGTAENFSFELGQGRMLPEFEEAVSGMKAGEKKTFPLTFPADYGVPTLDGASVEFEVEVLSVAEAVLPELNDEFAKTLGVENFEKMREDILQNLQREVKARLEQHNKALVMKAIEEKLTFDLPQSMIAEEEKGLAQQALTDLAARGLDVSKMKMDKLPTHLFTEQAKRRIRLGLFMSKMIAEQKIVVEDEAVRALAQNIASSYEKPEEVVEFIMKDANRVSNLRAQIMEENVTDWIYGQAKTTEEAVEFDKLMSGNF